MRSRQVFAVLRGRRVEDEVRDGVEVAPSVTNLVKGTLQW